LSVENLEPTPADERPVARSRSVDMAVSVIIFALAATLGYDSWRTGASWEAGIGPQSGYFPFYLSLIMGIASIYGFVTSLMLSAREGEAFVTRDQFGRVLKVLIPIIIFCLLTQFIGVYVSSFLLTTGFMWIVGRISLWVSLITGLVFSLLMFGVFEIAFNVILPKGPLEAALGY
jgi:putative tricarboxylic transport membrane protein